MPELQHTKKSQLSWAFYAWANSALATTVIAGFFPLFFKQYWSAGVEATTNNSRIGLLSIQLLFLSGMWFLRKTEEP